VAQFGGMSVDLYTVRCRCGPIWWDVCGFVDSSVWMWPNLVGCLWICRQFGVDVDQIGGMSVDL